MKRKRFSVEQGAPPREPLVDDGMSPRQQCGHQPNSRLKIVSGKGAGIPQLAPGSGDLLTSLENANRDALEKEVHVWTFRADLSGDACGKLYALLSRDEKAKADRFKFAIHRTRSIAARAALRLLAAQYVGIPAPELRFTYSSHGKPSLDGLPPANDVAFNLSHSGDYGVVAFTRRRGIGIDLEHVRERHKHARLAERYFSPRENVWLRTLPPQESLRAFYRLWVVKEAWLKATGKGLSVPLREVEVEFGACGEVALRGPEALGGEWYAQELDLVPGYASALVVEGKPCALKTWALDLNA